MDTLQEKTKKKWKEIHPSKILPFSIKIIFHVPNLICII